MKNLILREDRTLLLILGIFLAIISCANTLVQICGDALFISNIGIEGLPFMYIVSAIVMAVMAIGIIPVIDRIDRIKIYNITAGLLSLELLFCWGLAIFNVKWTYYLIYVTTYILEALLFLAFWLIAGSICHTRQAKRIFPIILGGSLIAGAITAFFTKSLAHLIQTHNILLVSGFLCLITIPISQRLSRFFTEKTSLTKLEERHKEISILHRLHLDLRIIWQSRLVRLLSISFILYTVLSFILEYEFNQAASLHFSIGGKVITERLAGFYGLIKGWVAVCAILLQFALSRRIIHRIGVCNTYVLMPILFLFGFLGIFLAKIFQGALVYLFFYAATSARFSHKTIAGSLYRSSGELLYNAVPSEKRGRVRAFYSAIVEPLGVGLAGGLIILAHQFSLYLAIFLSLIYIGIVAMRLKKNYIYTIVDMLKEKSGRLWESMSGTFGQYGIKEILGVVEKSLDNSDPNVRSFASELIGKTHDKEAVACLLEHIKLEDNNMVKENILKILRDMKCIEAKPLFESLLTQEDPRIVKIAVDGLGSIGDSSTLELIEPFLMDRDFSIQAKAIEISWRLGGEKESLKRLMENLFKNSHEKAKLPAIELAGNVPLPENLEYLMGYLRFSHFHGAPDHAAEFQMQNSAINALGKTCSIKAAESLIKLLELRNNRLSNLISITLSDMGEVAIDEIRKFLIESDIYTSYFLFKALEGMARSGVDIEKISRKELIETITKVIRQCYYHLHLNETLDVSPDKSATFLLNDALLEEKRKAEFNAICGLRLLDKNSERMNIISRNISHPDAFVRADAIEALENIGEPNLSLPLVGLLEHKAHTVQWQKRFNFPDMDISKVLEEFITSRHTWLCASAIFAIGELKLERFKTQLVKLVKEKNDLLRANAFEALIKIGYKFPEDLLQSLRDDQSPLVRRYIAFYKFTCQQ